MAASLRKLGALLDKDARDLLKNPTMVVAVILPAAMILLYHFVYREPLAVADGDPAVRVLIDGLFLASALCLSVGMVVSMTLIYGIAEEKEKHTLRTLMLANVSAGQVALAKGIVCLATTLVVGALCFALTGVGWGMFPAFIALTALGAVPVILLGLVLGLASRDQMTAGLYGTPILLLCLVPMFAPIAPEAEAVAAYTPLGGVCELLRLLLEGSLTPEAAALPLAVTAAWIAVGAVAFKFLYRRLAQDN